MYIGQSKDHGQFSKKMVTCVSIMDPEGLYGSRNVWEQLDDPWVRKIPWRKKWQPTPIFLPEKFHGQKRLAGYSLWDQKRVGYNWATKQQQPKVDHMVKKFKGYKAVFNENNFQYQHIPFKCWTSLSYYDMVHNILWLYHHLFMLSLQGTFGLFSVFILHR